MRHQKSKVFKFNIIRPSRHHREFGSYLCDVMLCSIKLF